MANILYPSSIGLFGIFNLWFERPANCTIISSIEQLLDGMYADLKEFASIVAIAQASYTMPEEMLPEEMLPKEMLPEEMLVRVAIYGYIAGFVGID